jgi:peptidoglycan/LPS O-acetylase OafA/YrhL
MEATAQQHGDAAAAHQPDAAGAPAPGLRETAPNLAPPPGNPRFPLFDSLRAIAALCVLAGHTVTVTYTLTQHSSLVLIGTDLAYQGVAIFFLISGFLLYRPFLVVRKGGRPLRLGPYLRRRVLRIVPAYWVALTVFLVLGMLSGVNGGNWWIFYGFGQIYRLRTLGSGIGVAWTLCIEVTFYLVLPFLAWIAARLGRGSLRGDWLLVVVLGALSVLYHAHFNSLADAAKSSTLPGTFVWFALGMALALISVHEPLTERVSALQDRRPAWPVVAWAGALAAFVILHELSHASSSLGPGAVEGLRQILFGVAAFLLLLPGAFGERNHPSRDWVRGLLRLRILGWLGLVSYGVYLYHSIVLAQLSRFALDHGIGARYLFVTVLGVVITVISAAASFYLIERPIMRWGRRR